MTLLQILFAFDGRVPRSVWWFYWLAVFVTLPVLAVLAGATRALGDAGILTGALAVVAAVPVLLWTTLAVSIKRWHDRDKGGVWVLIWLIPLGIGPIWTLVECGFLEGTPGPNRYGPGPMSRETTAQIFG